MPLMFHIQKKKPSASRTLPFLPRLGIYLDIAGYELVFKSTPFLEAVIELVEKGLPPSQLQKIAKKHLAEIQFPLLKKSSVVETTFRNIN